MRRRLHRVWLFRLFRPTNCGPLPYPLISTKCFPRARRRRLIHLMASRATQRDCRRTMIRIRPSPRGLSLTLRYHYLQEKGNWFYIFFKFLLYMVPNHSPRWWWWWWWWLKYLWRTRAIAPQRTLTRLRRQWTLYWLPLQRQCHWGLRQRLWSRPSAMYPLSAIFSGLPLRYHYLREKGNWFYIYFKSLLYMVLNHSPNKMSFFLEKKESSSWPTLDASAATSSALWYKWICSKHAGSGRWYAIAAAASAFE